MLTEKINENYIFRRLYRHGKSAVSPCVVLYYKKRGGAGKNRLGITATKKIGKAVQRNRARRIILESYRLLESKLALGYDFVIVARTRATGVKMQVVKSELEGLLKGIGGIKNSPQSPAKSR